ncbi:helix-turn-helix transcriptional regulator [Leuconostoc falkenbergense]|uniref:helix-turn-helix domain-containing protein n=1 Tax=Leuconostoc falkenbergense TaxID=2766470 RepID=UPI0024ADFE9F|nr:helix-turn-helix transcriptional regulator [Leuconostoc falkenbergense]MDI6667563.1 helix-turn-helix transcriptional regulator [Leuconostoc falkenbergense]
MTINFGQTIRQIRLAKGITQPEIYAGVMSRSFYSEFEHNHHHIRVDQFIALLKNLNVDISEFLFIANHYDFDDENELTQLVNDLYNERNISALLPLSEKYRHDRSRNIRFIAMRAYLLFYGTGNNQNLYSLEPLTELITFMRETDVDGWTLFELQLADNYFMTIKDENEFARLFWAVDRQYLKFHALDSKIITQHATHYFNTVQNILLRHFSKTLLEQVMKHCLELFQNDSNAEVQITLKATLLYANLYTDYQNTQSEAYEFYRALQTINYPNIRSLLLVHQTQMNNIKHPFYDTHGQFTNFVNHPSKTVSEILTQIKTERP